MRTAKATTTSDCHRSQHHKAQTRFLELRRRALLSELRAINRELHGTRPSRVRYVDEEYEL